MSIEVIYQGLTIARGPSFRLQDGGVFVEHDGPMPVATALSLQHGEHALHGRVRRVTEGTGAGMLIVPAAGQKLPRWLVALGPTSITNVELEPPPVVVAPPKAKSEPEAKSEPVAAVEHHPAATTAEAGAGGDAGGETGESAAASGHTPSENGDGSKDDEEDDKHAAKPTDKKTPAAGANANKKKKPRKR